MKYAQLIRLLVARELATRAIWLENGHVKMIGNPAEVVAAYGAN